MQSDWRWCHKCQGLAFALNQPSVCPAGGSHDHSGSGNYALAVDDPSAPGQSDWRWCKKCQGLAFSLNQPSVCPAGGRHDHSGSGNYTLAQDDPSPRGQSGWRWCKKCQGLAFSLNQPSVCPAGGSHDHSQSGNYTLASDAEAVPAVVSTADVVVRQTNPPSLTTAHPVVNPVVSPLTMGDKFVEFDLPVMLHEFLFELKKGGSTFWVGAAVPVGTVDFTRAQVYFHPTVVQAETVHARDRDYNEFKGGWSDSIQRYVPMEGGQLAGARLMPLLVPFTTMRALSKPAHNMFSDRPVETLNAILGALAREVTGNASEQAALAQIGVSSFSSGIAALRLFLKDMRSSGLVKEVIDFDSPYILSEPKKLTPSPGAVSKCYTQHVLPSPPPGWVNMPAQNFSLIRSYTVPHSIIGWMTYYMAMLTSAIL